MVLCRLAHVHYCLLTALRKPGILPRQMSGLPVRFIICSLAFVPSSALSLSGLWALDTCLPLGLWALNTCPSLGASRHQTHALPLNLWALDTCSPLGLWKLGTCPPLGLWAVDTCSPFGPLGTRPCSPQFSGFFIDPSFPNLSSIFAQQHCNMKDQSPPCVFHLLFIPNCELNNSGMQNSRIFL